MLDFRKLLKQGKEAEWVVMLFLRSNTELMKKLGITRCVLTDFLQPDENWDLSIKEVDCNTKKELNTISVEVKKGNTYGRLQTFWAEVISTGSMGYSHYLVHPPKLMVYFDVFTSKLYFYDGEQFVAKIKRLHLAGATSPNSYNTAIGTKFNLEDYKAGWLLTADVQQLWFEVRHTNWIQQLIEEQLNEKHNRPQVYKSCEGLPDLPSTT